MATNIKMLTPRLSRDRNWSIISDVAISKNKHRLGACRSDSLPDGYRSVPVPAERCGLAGSTGAVSRVRANNLRIAKRSVEGLAQ